MRVHAPALMVVFACIAAFIGVVAVDPSGLWAAVVGLYLGGVLAAACLRIWTWDPIEPEDES